MGIPQATQLLQITPVSAHLQISLVDWHFLSTSHNSRTISLEDGHLQRLTFSLPYMTEISVVIRQ